MSYHYADGVTYANSATRASHSVVVAFLLWFFLGAVSAHNWYLGRYYVATAQLGLNLCGLILLPTGLGLALLLAAGLWLFVDLFWIATASS